MPVEKRMAGSLLFAFHLPVYAAKEPEQAPDDSHKFAPNTCLQFPCARRQDHARHAGRWRWGKASNHRPYPRRRTRRPHYLHTRRPATSSMAIPSSAFRSRAIRIPSAPSGCRSARLEQARAMLIDAAAQGWKVDRLAPPPTEKWLTWPPPGSPMAHWLMSQPDLPPQNPTLRIRKISRSSADRSSASTRRKRSMARLCMASTRCCPA